MALSRNRSSGWVQSALLFPLIAVLAVPTSAIASGPPTGVSGEEWTTIQAQIEAERHTVVESDRPGRLYRADNPTQRFTAHFGAEDVLITPRGRGETEWQVGLRLTAWGDADDLQPVQPAGAIADGNRVEYRRGPLTEWYVNTTMGLEQGFTIEAPPGDDIGELVLEMTIEGDLTAELAENGQAVTFRQRGSESTLTYSGLTAWDAVETPLEGRMELATGGSRLRLVVSVTNVAWPITVDPIFTHVAKLLPTPRTDSTDAHFGRRVSVDGDFVVVGIDDRVYGESSGAAHIYRRTPDVSSPWHHVTKLVAPDGAANDFFGRSVSISEDTVAVGARGDDDLASNSGSVYVFRQNEGGTDTWGLVAKITADDGSSEDSFGHSVAISGDTLVVGAHLNDDHGTNSGSVYVFHRDEGGLDAWGQVAKLLADDGTEDDEFGISVAIDRDNIVVGAHRDGTYSRGSAYVFFREDRSPGEWRQVAKITAADGAAYEFFGRSVSISGDTAVIGSPGINFQFRGTAYVFQRNHGGSDAWGQVARLVDLSHGYWESINEFVEINGDTAIVGSPGYSSDQGRAHIFQRHYGGEDAWGQVTEITSSSGTDGDRFGYSVSLSGNTAVIGAPLTDAADLDSGTTYIHERHFGGPDSWGEIDVLSCPDEILGARGDNFGRSVAISGNTAIAGAPMDPTNGPLSGAAYIFTANETDMETMEWTKTARIFAADATGGEFFGHSVAVCGDTAVVGAHGDNEHGWMSGSAYVFVRDQGGTGTWIQSSKLLAPDGAEGDLFGYSVSVSGDTAMVGAYGDDASSGSVYAFSRDHGGPSNWGYVTKLRSPDHSADDYFGYAVSVKDDIAVIGAFGDDDNGYSSGAAYIYHRATSQPESWEFIVKKKPLDGITQDYFGKSVCTSDDSIIVGAPGDAYTLNSAYVFVRDYGGPDAWGEEAKLTPANNSTNGDFGESVSISGDIAIVGAPRDGSDDHGAVHLYRSSQANPHQWRQAATIIAFDAADYDEFGISTSSSGESVIVGAWTDDHLGTDSGSAYIFTIGDAFFTDGFESGSTSMWSVTEP